MEDAPISYEELAADALAADLGGRTFLVASLEALLRMKRAANREKDRVVLAQLEEAVARKKGS